MPSMFYQASRPKTQEPISAALHRILTEIKLALDESKDTVHQQTE